MMKEDEIKRLNRQGAKSIIQDYLKITKGEIFLIICDETTREIADYVETEANELGARVEIIQVNADAQEKVKNRNNFPKKLPGKIANAQCILNILNAKPECTPFRKQIIEQGQRFGTRIAHAPGLRTEHLRSAFQADFTEMLRWNDILIRLLYFAADCTIVTKDKQDASYELHLNLGGKERLPAQSAQVLDGAWTNIPGAEVYIAPIEKEAYGDIIINGSMLGHILPCDVLITFKNGKIQRWKAMDMGFQAELDDFAKKWEHDLNWNCLCEFGIGVNNAFKKVTGIQVLDEKMKETCHLGIGTNKEFSGKIDSEIHQDFVTVKPTIIIDGKTIMKNGHFTIDEADVFEDLEQMNVPENMFSGQEYRLTVRDMEEEDGKVGLGLRDGTDQYFFLQVGNDPSSRTILDVLNQLNPTPEFSYDQIKALSHQAPAILSLLLKYDFIERIKNEK
jgi:leucyl aminopeptidase (aminopeptidase T)